MSWNILLIALIAMVIFQIIGIRMQSKRSSHLTTLMDNFNNEDTFFELAKKAEEEEKDPEYLQKCRVIHLWGAAYYNKNDDFKNTLDKLDLSVLTGKDGKITINEDAFFYLYLIIPHFLYTEKKFEQVQLLDEKLKDVKAEDTLIYNLAKENVKFYKKEGDSGKAFYEKVIEGDYANYKYSKQLIGLYKNIISAMLASIYKEENSTDKYNDVMDEVREFAKSPLGERWISELGFKIEEINEPEKKEEETKE